ncbi:MAG: transglutaminase-like domain-containing protein [Pyrinomonadaceae bacterium]
MARAAPPQDGFSLGGTNWDIRGYAVDPRLQPFRIYFNNYCSGRAGIAAALCLSDRFAEQFPFGHPNSDLFDVDYDPVAALTDHTEKGHPGDCVTRSGLAAAALLSVGIPARVVQLMPLEGDGHNIFSVWDEEYGWVAIDATYGQMIGNKDGPSSAFDAYRYPDKIMGYPIGQVAIGAPEMTGNYNKNSSYLFRGHITYPEPWLYLRTGSRVAPWPFRAKFIELGPRQWRMGPAQTALRYGIAICVVLLMAGMAVPGRRPPKVARQ